MISSIASYFIDKSERLEFNLVQQVQINIQKTKSVLSYLLPAFVRNRVKDGMRTFSEDQGIVSIIFCDIYNFEEILRLYSPKELTVFLDELFAKIDQKCSISGCTKIETVGKTYMACAGLKDSEIEQEPQFSSVSHARRTVEMGISIINLCDHVLLKNGESLKMKIGINSGPVTAGVVGFHKPQFSLVGDTVNTASRMASLCPESNTIQISESTFASMVSHSGLEFTPNKIRAKGKGDLNTFLVSISIHEFKALSDTVSNYSDILTRNSRDAFLGPKMFEFSTKENSKRRSSNIENLNSIILAEAGEFRRSETHPLEEIKCFAFGFQESEKEAAFRVESSETNLFVSKLGLQLRIFCDLVFLILSFISSAFFSRFQYYSIIKLLIELVILLVLHHRFNKDYKKLIFTLCLGYTYLIGAGFRLFDYQKNYEIVFMDYLLYLLQASLCSQLLFNTLSWSISLIACVQIIACLSYPNMNSAHIISSIIFLIVLLCIVYSRERKLRIFSRIKTSAQRELAKTDELLNKMMPKNALENVKQQNQVTEYIHGVTILYADIAGFTL